MAVPSADVEYAPWVGGPFRWRLGLRPLDLADWIELDDDHAADLAVKAQVRAAHPETVFVALPGAIDACAEVLDALVDHLVERWPQHFHHVGGAVRDTLTGDIVPVDGTLHPLDAASRLVQEDLIVMIEVGGELVFGAGSVCFPNRWDLRSKLGLPLRDVHAPVSRLNEQLADTIDGVFSRLTPERSFWRLGWGVLDSHELYQPTDGTAAPRPASPAVDDLVVRVERETIRRFARTRAVLFTIRTYRTPAATLAADPRHRPVIAEALAAMPTDVRDYKQLDGLSRALDEAFTDAGSPAQGRASSMQ